MTAAGPWQALRRAHLGANFKSRLRIGKAKTARSNCRPTTTADQKEKQLVRSRIGAHRRKRSANTVRPAGSPLMPKPRWVPPSISTMAVVHDVRAINNFQRPRTRFVGDHTRSAAVLSDARPARGFRRPATGRCRPAVPSSRCYIGCEAIAQGTGDFPAAVRRRQMLGGFVQM